MSRRTAESAVLRACLDYLQLRGICHWRANQIPAPVNDGKGFRRFWGLRGVSDICGVLPGGRFLACECKSATGKLTPHQRLFLQRVNELGGLGVVVRDVKELAEALEGIGG